MTRKKHRLEIYPEMTLPEKMRERLRYAKQEMYAYTLIEVPGELVPVVQSVDNLGAVVALCDEAMARDGKGRHVLDDIGRSWIGRIRQAALESKAERIEL